MNDQTQKTQRVMTCDIRGAKRNDWDNCPLARAIRREHPGNDVQVFDEHLLINGEQFSHTEETREFASAWDLNDGPFRAVTLKVPDFTDALRTLEATSVGRGGDKV